MSQYEKDLQESTLLQFMELPALTVVFIDKHSVEYIKPLAANPKHAQIGLRSGKTFNVDSPANVVHELVHNSIKGSKLQPMQKF